jgi:putative ABC transport system permease protein
MGMDDPIGKTFALYGRRAPIVGVVKNTFYHSLRTVLRPQVFYLFTNLPRQTFSGVVLIRVKDLDRQQSASHLPDVIAHVEKVWGSVNSFAPFEYHFLNETIDAQYKGEQRLGRLFSYFAFLAIFISCLGLFGLASFVTEQRTKEIGIRKTLGASLGNIIVMLSKDFTKWVLVANIIAWPVAWYAMAKWLQNFAYRTHIAWWTFLAAGTTAFLIAWLTIIFQTYKSARANPVDALKYE